ncbi:MAG: trimethylamine methyltransferase family protein, partial [Pseudomonadota bacterium]
MIAPQPQNSPSRSRRSSRQGRIAQRTARYAHMLPALKRALPHTDPLTREQVLKIDDASMQILEDVGVVFRDPIALEDWRKAGADVRSDDRVHLDRGLVRELVASIPSEVTLHARDPQKSVPIGGDH